MAGNEGICYLNTNNCMVESCIEWCLTSWWVCLSGNMWWRRSIEIRSNGWNHSTHLTSMDTSSSVISKHPHNFRTSSITFHSFQYRRQACIQMESRSTQRRMISWTKWKNWIHQNSYVILYLVESILYTTHSFNWAFNRDIVSLTFITSFNSNTSPRPLWRSTSTSCWQIRYMSNLWRLDWNKWKWNSQAHGMNEKQSSRSTDTIW